MLPNNLKKYRRKAGLTQAELSKLTKVHRNHISNFETGAERPWPKFRRRAAEILGVPECDLFPRREVFF